MLTFVYDAYPESWTMVGQVKMLAGKPAGVSLTPRAQVMEIEN